MNGVGFEILARTPVPKLLLGYPPPSPRGINFTMIKYREMFNSFLIYRQLVSIKERPQSDFFWRVVFYLIICWFSLQIPKCPVCILRLINVK